MIEINDKNDIQKLYFTNSFNQEILEFLKKRFSQIENAMRPYIVEKEQFTLAPNGPFYILEKGDVLTNLESAGLNACDKGLFGTIPEFINLIPYTRCWYEIGIIYNNDYMPYFYINTALFPQHSKELNHFLKRYS